MKVLLIDDHPLILSALQAVAGGFGADPVVVGAESAAAARAALRATTDFDLVLLDLQLGDADGFDLLAEFRAASPALPVVVLSASERQGDVIRAIDAGAMGFVPKRASNGTLFEALRLVMAGGIYVPPMSIGAGVSPPTEPETVPEALRIESAGVAAPAASSRQVGERGAGGARSFAAIAMPGGASSVMPGGSHAAPGGSPHVPPSPGAAAPGTATGAAAWRQTLSAFGLTPRQSEVLALLLKGQSNKLIARELSLSVETVKDHVAAVMRALGVNSRTQAVVAVTQLAASGATLAPARRPA